MPFEMIDNKKEGSHVKAFGWDGADRVQVEFDTGKKAVYFNVSEKMWETLVEANDMKRAGNYISGILAPGRKFEYVNELPPAPEE